MKKKYTMLSDVSFLNSNCKDPVQFKKYFDEGLFSDETKWQQFVLNAEIPGVLDAIKSRMKYSMSKLSLGVYNVLENGPGKNITSEEEIYLFTGFAEIETVSRIGTTIMLKNASLPPAVFPNSVHHISLCYFTILKKLTSYNAAVIDGLLTNLSFIHFMKYRVCLPEPFVVVSGEESSNYFDLDLNHHLNIVTSLVSFRVNPLTEKGFYFCGEASSLEEIKDSASYQEAIHVFTDKITFPELKNEKEGKVYTEYPFVIDNPCAVAYRLAMPFYLDLHGKSIIIEKSLGKYYYYEVNL